MAPEKLTGRGAVNGSINKVGTWCRALGGPCLIGPGSESLSLIHVDFAHAAAVRDVTYLDLNEALEKAGSDCENNPSLKNSIALSWVDILELRQLDDAL